MIVYIMYFLLVVFYCTIICLFCCFTIPFVFCLFVVFCSEIALPVLSVSVLVLGLVLVLVLALVWDIGIGIGIIIVGVIIAGTRRINARSKSAHCDSSLHFLPPPPAVPRAPLVGQGRGFSNLISIYYKHIISNIYHI